MDPLIAIIAVGLTNAQPWTTLAGPAFAPPIAVNAIYGRALHWGTHARPANDFDPIKAYRERAGLDDPERLQQAQAKLEAFNEINAIFLALKHELREASGLEADAPASFAITRLSHPEPSPATARLLGYEDDPAAFVERYMAEDRGAALAAQAQANRALELGLATATNRYFRHRLVPRQVSPADLHEVAGLELAGTFQHTRAAGAIFIDQARQAVAAADSQRALAWLKRAFRFATALEHDPSLMNLLLARSIEANTLSEITRMLAVNGLDEQSLAALDALIAERAVESTTTLDYVPWMLDIAEHRLASTCTPTGVLLPGLRHYAALNTIPILEVLDLPDSEPLENALGLLHPRRPTLAHAIQLQRNHFAQRQPFEFDNLEEQRATLNNHLAAIPWFAETLLAELTVLDRLIQTEAILRARRAALRVMIAIHQFMLAHDNQPPHSLAALAEWHGQPVPPNPLDPQGRWNYQPTPQTDPKALHTEQYLLHSPVMPELIQRTMRIWESGPDDVRRTRSSLNHPRSEWD